MPSQTQIGVSGMVKRGEIWIVSGGPDYAGKPRPAVIVQDKLFGQVDSVTIGLLTRDSQLVSPSRVPVRPDGENGIERLLEIMVKKISTVNLRKLGKRIGVLSTADVIELERSLVWYLGLLHLAAGKPASSR